KRERRCCPLHSPDRRYAQCSPRRIGARHSMVRALQPLAWESVGVSGRRKVDRCHGNEYTRSTASEKERGVRTKPTFSSRPQLPLGGNKGCRPLLDAHRV